MTELLELRAEVDRIDDAVVDLLVKRMAVVANIALLKGDQRNGRAALRPAREASIMRRLSARAGTAFPGPTLVRMWRELLAATTSRQAPLSIAVAGRRLWLVARDHFGSFTPITVRMTAAGVLDDVAQGRVQIAVLPPPGADEAWWRKLVDPHQPAGRIVARLPFVDNEDDPDAANGFVVAKVDFEPSGDDITMIDVETSAGAADEAIVAMLAKQGYAARILATAYDRDWDRAQHLTEIEGFVSHDAAGLRHAVSRSNGMILRIQPLGGYPRPSPAGGTARAG